MRKLVDAEVDKAAARLGFARAEELDAACVGRSPSCASGMAHAVGPMRDRPRRWSGRHAAMDSGR